MNIKYQTSELVPAPYAHAIQLDLNEGSNKTLHYNLDLEYLDRDQLTEEEIFEEGFTLSDDFQLKGELPQAWLEEYTILLSKTEKTNKTELEESEDFWLLDIDGEPFYPKNTNQWSNFLEQIRQAILESSGYEKPLEITVVEIENKEKKNTIISGSFTKRVLKVQGPNGMRSLKWNLLSNMLKDIYSGDFDYDQAKTKVPNKDGLYINLGDEFWFELGVSYINNPKKVKSWL